MLRNQPFLLYGVCLGSRGIRDVESESRGKRGRFWSLEPRTVRACGPEIERFQSLLRNVQRRELVPCMSAMTLRCLRN